MTRCGASPLNRLALVDTIERMLKTMREAWGAMGRGKARWVERDDVGALVTPFVPNRSVVNSVIYQPGGSVIDAYDWLEEEYAEVDAWTVWVPETDTETASFLESKGHHLDADPAMMAIDLPSYAPTLPLPEWKPATVEELARINEAAYPWHDGSMERAVLEAAFDDAEYRLYITADACVLGIVDVDGDAGVMLVATLPEARGRGLAGGLLAAALVQARDRGCDISTLQATKMGEPVYARLGYQRLGAIQMWEKRKA
jgi:GNAT superfamily N-acetyltransferase